MGKKTQKIMGTLLLVLAIAVTQIPVSDAWATTASASDFQLEGTTLVKYVGTETTVSVPDTVKIIGREAFRGDEDLYSVSLPEGLQAIEYGAFSNCSVLKKINFPESLTQIGSVAFSNCKILSDVTIGKNIESIGPGAFSGCESLKDLVIHKDNTYFTYDSGILYQKEKKELLQALAGNGFTEYDMPSTIKSIAPYAFWGCRKLQLITLNSNITEIPERAFANCKNLNEANIPTSVKSIHETAFEGCFNLQIVAPDGSVAAEYAKNRDTSDVALREYEEVSQAEYQDDEYMQELIQKVMAENNLPGSSTEERDFVPLLSESEGVEVQSVNDQLGQTSIVGNHAVVFIDNTRERVLSGVNTIQETTQEVAQEGTANVVEEDKIATLSSNDSDSQPIENTENIADTLQEDSAKKSSQFPKYTLVDDVIVANQAYYKDAELIEFKIPDGVLQIGDFAFARSGLKEMIIPEGVTDIGYGAFYHCNNLESISIPSSVTNIEPSAFAKTKWLNSWQMRSNTNDYNIVGDGILIAYKGKDSFIEVPEGIKQIGSEVFKNHMGITKVSLPSSLLAIGEEAFAGCSNLKEVTGGSNLQNIRDRAFDGCPIETVRIPATVRTVGLRAFNETQSTRANEVTPVVFMGTELPTVSYEDTATRLSNQDYRNLSFQGISVAVVDAAVENFENTVLSKDHFGFRGLVCSIVQENDGKTAGILKIKQCTVVPDAQGSIVLPKSVTIYGKKYEFADIEATKTLIEPEKSSDTVEENAIQVRVNSEILKETNVITAILSGNTKEYILSIKDSESAKETLKKAYRTIYGESKEVQMNAFDVALYDLNGTIPLKKIGKESLMITIPFPTNIVGNPQVVCTDENGQLERVESNVVQVNGTNCISFAAKHFSPYGIYTYGGNTAVVENGDAVFINSMRRRDASPDTGDGIHPKWFLAIGLFALSLIFFLQKKPFKPIILPIQK